MAEKISTSTTVSGHGLNKRKTTSTTTTKTSKGRSDSNTTIKTSRSVGEILSIGGSLFGLILLMLLVVSVIKSLLGSDPITFGGLLETLASAPNVDMSLKSFEVIAPLSWEGGEFVNLFKRVFNVFITTFNVIVYAHKGLLQVAYYVAWVIRFIFV